MELTYDYKMFKETFESEFTWLNGFMRNVSRFGYKNAVIDSASDKRWTYSQLNCDANRLANAFKSDNVKKFDVVFMQLLIVRSFFSDILRRRKSAQYVILLTLIFLREKPLKL